MSYTTLECRLSERRLTEHPITGMSFNWTLSKQRTRRLIEQPIIRTPFSQITLMKFSPTSITYGVDEFI